MGVRQTFAPLALIRRKGRLLADDGASRPDARIVEAVARAYHWQALLDDGRFASISDVARAEGLRPTTVARLLRLARLAPDIIDALMAGQQPVCMTLHWLQRHDIPALWVQQRAVLAALD